MGMAHILYLYEDGLTTYDAAKTKEAVATAVMKVCLAPHEFTSGGAKQIRTAAVLGDGNCVNHVAEVHSTDEQIFVWTGNCLRTLAQLKDQEVDAAKKLFDELYEDRKKRRA